MVKRGNVVNLVNISVLFVVENNEDIIDMPRKKFTKKIKIRITN